MKGGDIMREIKNISFQNLGKRELLKAPVWWIGLIGYICIAIYYYVKSNPAQ
jgi:hypothetical protein